MHKRSHCKLAGALLRREHGFSARRYELAFLFGSFQPDCNPLSYLKGSLRSKRFGGHTYGNSRPFIERRITRLQNRKTWNLWSYYTLGKLTHYVADAFTWPHNPDFPGGPMEHHMYERSLRFALADCLNGETTPVFSRKEGPRAANLPEKPGAADFPKEPGTSNFPEDPRADVVPDAPRANLPEALAALHAQYLHEGNGGTDRDLRYILRSGCLLMAGCRPPERAKGSRAAWDGAEGPVPQR